MPIPSLPLELSDAIIAWIPVVSDRMDYYRDLRSCSLVCHAWLPASRYRLFRDIHINDIGGYDLLVSRVLHVKEMTGYLRFVRAVYLSFSFVRKVADESRVFPLEFAGLLPNLTRMGLRYRAVDAYMSHPSSFMAMSRFSSLQTLSIFNSEFPSFGAFRRTLTSLPSLKNLELDQPSWPEPVIDPAPLLPHGASTVSRPALLGLHIFLWHRGSAHRRCARQFISWLSETATSSSLHSLKLDSAIEPMDLFGPSLLRLAQVAQDLQITVSESDRDYELLFAGFTNLETLHMDFQYVLPQPNLWSRMKSFVHSLPSPARLAELSITSYNRSSPLSSFDGLEVLDAALLPERFNALKLVSLHGGGVRSMWPNVDSEAHQAFLDTIRHKLPSLLSRDILRVYIY